MVAVYTVGLSPMFRALLELPFGLRLVAAVAAQLPIGLVLGMFMPLGVAVLARRHVRLVPWAWGINGCTSVLSAILATILAIHFGFTAVVGLAMALYGLAAAMLYRPLSQAQNNE